MPEITDEKLLPEWMRAALRKERELFPDSKFPQHLGAPGYRAYDLGDGWWAWDNGTGGVLISDGKPTDSLQADSSGVRWINYVDVMAFHPHWTPVERMEAGQRADAGLRKPTPAFTGEHDEHLRGMILMLLREHDWQSDELDLLGIPAIDFGGVGRIVDRAAGLFNPPKDFIWHARSELDGYFVVLFLSPPGDVAVARAKAWELYTNGSHRPNVLPETGEPEWKEYHTDPRGLEVNELGPDWDGSDGEGHVEVESMNSSPAMVCEEVHANGTRCRLPIGHGVFPHRTEAWLEWFTDKD